MIEISLNKIKKSYGFKDILNNITFEIHTGERVSIVGDNGSGKTTLLNIINGIEKEDSGTVTIRKGLEIGYLNQLPENIYNEKIVKKVLYESLDDVLKLEEKMNRYEKKMKDNPSDISIINKYLNVQDEYIKAGGYEINTLIDKVAHGLNINEFLEKKMNELSGGEQRRVLLASLIIKKPEILILDEPTNHLDINTLEWLESFLNKYKGTILIVSHDRYFLDKVTTKTILLENSKSVIFHGNYSYYLKENELRIEREFKEYKDQQKIIKEMKRKIKQLEEFGKLAYPGGDPFFRRAENIRKRLERLELKDKPVTKKDLPINLDFNTRSGKDALVVKNYDLKIQENILIKNINFKINYGEKVCIIGENGSGKSTLIKRIIESNEKENIRLGTNIKIGYIPQQITFDKDVTVLDFAKEYFIGEESHLRSALDKYYFHGENVFKKVNKLSGGEKVRLKLFALIQGNSNFIILDEPTNHIDIYTKETLETALKEYKGTLLFISHDRYFINELADKILYINDKRIKENIGNYDDFVNHKK